MVFKHEIQLIKVGKESEAAGSIIKKDGVKVIAMLKGLGWGDDDANSILGEAIAVIFKKVREGKISEFNSTYLWNTARNIGSNEYRWLQNNKFYLQEKEFFEKEYDIVIQDYDSSGMADDNRIKTFKMLGERCQELIKLKHIDGKTHTEISNTLPSISSADVSKTNLNRCMKKWKKLLENLQGKAVL